MCVCVCISFTISSFSLPHFHITLSSISKRLQYYSRNQTIEIKKMAERGSGSDSRRKDKGKAKINEPSIHDLNTLAGINLNSDKDKELMAAFQDYMSGDPGMISPFKKRRGQEGREITQGAPSNIQQDPELKHDKIPHNSPAPPSDAPAQVQGNAEGPGSRYYPPDDYCFVKTLTAYDVIPINPTLHLDANEAIDLAEDPDIKDYRPGTYSKTLLVFDSSDRRYNMPLTNYCSGGVVRYQLGGEWKRFVRVHNLKAGDEITFYQIYDRRVSDDYYYVIKYFRKPPDKKGFVRSGMYRGKPSDYDKPRDSKGNYKVESKGNERSGVVIK